MRISDWSSDVCSSDLVSVAIANPCELVSIGSDTDINARKLGATIYLRDHPAHRMIHASISEDRASLVQGMSRAVLIFDMTLDADLEVQQAVVRSDKINVAYRLSYQDIPLVLAASEHESGRPSLGERLF